MFILQADDIDPFSKFQLRTVQQEQRRDWQLSETNPHFRDKQEPNYIKTVFGIT